MRTLSNLCRGATERGQGLTLWGSRDKGAGPDFICYRTMLKKLALAGDLRSMARNEGEDDSVAGDVRAPFLFVPHCETPSAAWLADHPD